MTEILWFSRDPARLPAIAALPPIAAASAGWEAAPTQRALWIGRAERVARIALPGPWTAVELPDGILAWNASGAQVRAGAELVVDLDPLHRWGADLSIARDELGPWTLPSGEPVPTGAAWAESTRPWVRGLGLVWADSGFVYRWALSGRPSPIGRGDAFHFDRTGRVSPGQAPCPVPHELVLPADAVRRSARLAGLRVVAVRTEQDAVRGWLRDGAVVRDLAVS